MILELIRTILGSGEFGGDAVLIALVQLIALAFILLCCLPFHEFAHAWMANKLGDETPRFAGRLTLNPFAHLDWLGAAMMLLVGIGYAKPVPINPRNMRCGTQKGLALTSLAGPASNILLAFVILLISNIIKAFAGNGSNETVDLINYFLGFAARINITLAVFNLLPLPPLDGFNILQIFLPYKAMRFVSQYHAYIRYALLAVLLLGWLSQPIYFLSGMLERGLSWLADLPFALIG
ncbi:MAG: site-2 protease family protein [Oscillospiraceae bacterium]|nr:site-2 protease family protein [Oscillospiraceae bacterium]